MLGERNEVRSSFLDDVERIVSTDYRLRAPSVISDSPEVRIIDGLLALTKDETGS